MEEINGMLTAGEIEIAGLCLRKALELGADKARVTLNKSLMELFGTLNGELDKVSHCLDRSISVCLFVEGKFGSFSTNRLATDELDSFLGRAISTVRMLADDPCRDLPAPERTAWNAAGGKELDLYDEAYPEMTADQRVRMAMDAAIFKRHSGDGLISEEGEYSDSIFDSLVLDSNGLRCRHTETSFEYGVEVTVQDPEGNRFSSYWWDAAPKLKDLRIDGCGEVAFRRAMAQIGPVKVESGKYSMVIDSEVASRLITPVLNALGGYSLQQKNSFMLDSLGKKVFPEWLNIWDRPASVGETGSRLFDSEGVATRETPIVEKGVVKEYFVNTYMSMKMGVAPTVEDATRPVVLPCVAPSLMSVAEPVTKSVAEPATKSVAELATKSVAELVTKSVAELATKSVAELATKSVAELATKSVAELVEANGERRRISETLKTVVRQAHQPVAEPATKSVAEPATKSVAEPVEAPAKAPETFGKEEMMRLLGEGILVTGFNGGNSNSATGDFSFGVEGVLFKDGKIVHPVGEMRITGNLLALWNSLLAAGNDARFCKSKLIPTLAFGNVDFSA